MSIFDEPKIDCHNHVLDPARFAYADDVAYRPCGQEIATRSQHVDVMDAYGVKHALLVGPNSGYGSDNRCLLADLDMFVQVQVEHDQLLALAPQLQAAGARILIDHCGRPTPSAGLAQSGFQALLALARTGRAAVKLSGFQKFSAQASPHPDAAPFVRALVDAFTLDACLWASDWPFLRAPQRLDYGPLLKLVERWFPDPADRRRLLWDTPRRLFGFSSQV